LTSKGAFLQEKSSNIERQKDRQTGEVKYRILGSMVSGDLMEVVAKLGPTGKLFIITAYSI
jgi:hypothetical protein